MDVGLVLAFWGVALLLIVVPGADWAFTIAAALAGRVAPAVGGLTVGYAGMTVVVAAGLGALVAGTPAVLTVLTVAGGAYLIWLGARVLATRTGPVPAAGGPGVRERDGGWATVVRGLGVSGLNPKALLLFVALLPQFTDPDGSWPVAVQLGLLGLVFTASCAAFYATMGRFARAVLHARPAAARLVSRLSGLGMVVVGVGLMLERLSH
ncbi:LysE family translocator [Micromonospora costi]|uniref:LysE family translocator n=1 Tax=Micromonospora costi TaxID=1530042 RepID=A0A3B0ACQ8_9ACTN|nr:LysE family translocator [Micromonospora costi]RKN57487.1 LysE family translocator [Micromonospora costi]